MTRQETKKGGTAAIAGPQSQMPRSSGRKLKVSPGSKPAGFGVSAAHSEQTFKPGEAGAPKTVGQRIGGAARSIAGKVGQKLQQFAAGAQRPAHAMARSIACPECEGEMSLEFVLKALDIEVTKALEDEMNGDFEDDDDIIEEEIGDEDEEADEDEAEKAVSGKLNYVGNKEQSHRGPHKPGKMHSSTRTKTGEAVQRHNRPTNPVNEKGMAKSLRLPVIVGDAQMVQYTMGEDEAIAKSIEQNRLHIPAARNMRSEQESYELAKSEGTEEEDAE